MGFSGGSSGKEPACQCKRHKRHRFEPWVWKGPWRRAWQPTPALLPRESHGERSLVGYSPWGHKELDINWGEAMAPHSGTLAWKIPLMEEPGPGLQSMRSLRVRDYWATSLSLFTFLHWKRKWQPTPVFLLGESQGQGRLVGCRLWGHTESDTTKVT